MSWNAQILGGHRDGDIVPCIGPVLRLPKPVNLVRAYVAPIAALPLPSPLSIDAYRLERGDDGELYYVLM